VLLPEASPSRDYSATTLAGIPIGRARRSPHEELSEASRLKEDTQKKFAEAARKALEIHDVIVALRILVQTPEEEFLSREEELQALENELQTRAKELQTQEKELKTQENELQTREKELQTQEKELQTWRKELQRRAQEVNRQEAENLRLSPSKVLERK
jgi:uncharacterized protein (DUF3084 family)